MVASMNRRCAAQNHFLTPPDQRCPAPLPSNPSRTLAAPIAKQRPGRWEQFFHKNAEDGSIARYFRHSGTRDFALDAPLGGDVPHRYEEPNGPAFAAKLAFVRKLCSGSIVLSSKWWRHARGDTSSEEAYYCHSETCACTLEPPPEGVRGDKVDPDFEQNIATIRKGAKFLIARAPADEGMPPERPMEQLPPNVAVPRSTAAIVDTNILLKELGALRHLFEGQKHSVTLVVPQIVRVELQGLCHRAEGGTDLRARQALGWLEQHRAARWLRSQRQHEVTPLHEASAGQCADDLILSCALYYFAQAKAHGGRPEVPLAIRCYPSRWLPRSSVLQHATALPAVHCHLTSVAPQQSKSSTISGTAAADEDVVVCFSSIHSHH